MNSLNSNVLLFMLLGFILSKVGRVIASSILFFRLFLTGLCLLTTSTALGTLSSPPTPLASPELISSGPLFCSL